MRRLGAWLTMMAGCAGPAAEVPAPVAIEPSPPEGDAPLELPEAEDPPPITLLGRWEGIGVQKNGGTWKMVLTIESLSPGRCAAIDYPSIGCGGHWECTEASDGRALDGMEEITYGEGLCIDHIPVHVRLARDGESVAFVVEAGADSAEATLTRAAP
jgi:hypothetical protein